MAVHRPLFVPTLAGLAVIAAMTACEAPAEPSPPADDPAGAAGEAAAQTASVPATPATPATPAYSILRPGNRYAGPLGDRYLDEVQPVLGRRCAVCHACTNGPCQLNMT